MACKKLIHCMTILFTAIALLSVCNSLFGQDKAGPESEAAGGKVADEKLDLAQCREQLDLLTMAMFDENSSDSAVRELHMLARVFGEAFVFMSAMDSAKESLLEEYPECRYPEKVEDYVRSFGNEQWLE